MSTRESAPDLEDDSQGIMGAEEEPEEEVEEADEESEGLEEEESLDEENAVEEDTSDVGYVQLPTGESLSANDTGVIRRLRRTRLIVLAGDIDSGKTTLLGSVFLRFQQGPFAGYLFAGSQTLMGFEMRCWPSRAASMGRKATTHRTPAGQHNFYHLRVRQETLSSQSRDLLFCDISGEVYELAAQSSSACRELLEIQQADHFSLLIDGLKIRSFSQRNLALSNARQLLRRLLDTNMLSSEASVQILFTKEDVLRAGIDEIVQVGLIKPIDAEDYCLPEEAEQFIAQAMQIFKQEFGGRLKNLKYFRVAPRADLEGYDLASGVEDIFPLWVEVLPQRSALEQLPALPQPIREMDKFLFRALGKVDH
jgi:hypothetical protein